MQDQFDRIYIINLAHRTDRWQEIQEQLQRIGVPSGHPKVQRFDAVRPDDAGPFPSIGARGCFMSHLGVLQDAVRSGWQRILILEDDLDFSTDFVSRWPTVGRALDATDWRVFYGAYELPEGAAAPQSSPLSQVASTVSIGTTPFIAFQGSAIAEAAHYLTAMLERPAGSAEGGPMHVDGAYTWLRRSRPQWSTWVSHPQLGHQRPSRTDIHALPWYDEIPGLRDLAQWARRLKRLVASKA